jgi:signal transduction histidine kinase
MIDRSSLRFRLTAFYTVGGFALFTTFGFLLLAVAFGFTTRPLASSLAHVVRSVEASVASAPAGESLESIQRRVVARESTDGIVVAAIAAAAMRQVPLGIHSGEMNIAGFFALSPTFVPLRDGGFIIFAARTELDRMLAGFFVAAGVVLALALWAAWVLARALTREALRPLFTVTAELERFARGDFGPSPLQIARLTEFGDLASAYNAAAANVTEAFGERRRVEGQIRQFVAEAGHELRTPLTVVAGYVDVLRRGGFDDVEQRRNAFAALATEIKRMRALVERLMTLARLDRGLEVQAEPEVVDVGAIIKQAVESFAVIAEAPIAFELSSEALVLGAPDDVYEAVANLIENALKYGEGTPVAVSVVSSGGRLAVRVRDGGPGIALDDRERIFERFYRGAERGAVAGSGLGLSIVAKAVERLGGRVVLEDGRPGSTTFLLEMPALEGISVGHAS